MLGVADIRPLGATGTAIVEAFRGAGGRVILAVPPGTDPPPGVPLREYAAPMDGAPVSSMTTGAGDGETITGLAAAGAHLVLAAGDPGHLGGHVVCPVIRVGYDDAHRRALADDLDGQIGDLTPTEWVARILAVAGGTLTASEELGAAVFAIQRIGPTL